MECGDCTACCILSFVKELDKKAGEKCIHCVNNGCQIYGNHPQSCKDFKCAYLQAGKTVELRPDKCGMMFFKKNEQIFVGAYVPDKEITDMAKGQVQSLKEQGYSVVLLKVGERPFILPTEGRRQSEVYEEYIKMLEDGNV